MPSIDTYLSEQMFIARMRESPLVKKVDYSLLPEIQNNSYASGRRRYDTKESMPNFFGQMLERGAETLEPTRPGVTSRYPTICPQGSQLLQALSYMF